jgi:YVTN family beta-propeller protein
VVSHDGSRAYVANAVDKTVSVINTDSVTIPDPVGTSCLL